MHIAYPALTSLLITAAIPSVGQAQVLSLWDDVATPHGYHLDHAVPVATVSRVGQPLALGGGRIIQDPAGEPFVLGTATLDLNDYNARIHFTMTNTTETPIALKEVFVSVSAFASHGTARPAVSMGQQTGRAVHAKDDRELAPGASITVDMPIARTCQSGCDFQCLLVSVARYPFPTVSSGPDEEARNYALLLSAFDKLRSQGQQ